MVTSTGGLPEPFNSGDANRTTSCPSSDKEKPESVRENRIESAGHAVPAATGQRSKVSRIESK
jgi:hypothetical protein